MERAMITWSVIVGGLTLAFLIRVFYELKDLREKRKNEKAFTGKSSELSGDDNVGENERS